MLFFLSIIIVVFATSSQQIGENNEEIKCLRNHSVKYCDARR